MTDHLRIPARTVSNFNWIVQGLEA